MSTLDSGAAAVMGAFGFENTHVADAVSGAADFGASGADKLLIARSDGADVRAPAAICRQRPPAAVALRVRN